MGKGPLSWFLSQNLHQLAARGTFSVAAFALCVLVLYTRPVAAQNCATEKVQARIAEIEHELLPRLGAVRLHRIEALEDAVFVRKSGSTSIESPFLLYQIEQRRFYLKDGEVVENVTAGSFSQYVGISRDGEQVYRLAGFPDPERDFKRLVTDFSLVPPHNVSEAESRALFCARVVFGQETRQWLLDEAQAKARVGDWLSEHDKDASNQTTRWWRDFRRGHPDISLKLTTTGEAGGTFTTRLPLFWAPVESNIEPKIRELKIQVQRDGACHQFADTASLSRDAAMTRSAAATMR